MVAKFLEWTKVIPPQQIFLFFLPTSKHYFARASKYAGELNIQNIERIYIWIISPFRMALTRSPTHL